MITVQSQTQGNVEIIDVGGRVDGFAAPQLDEALQSAIRSRHYKLVVDLADTEFLSSAGIRALLKARIDLQDKGGMLRLAAPSEFINDSLKLVGLDKLFAVYDSRQAALADF